MGTATVPSISRGHRNRLIYWISIIYKIILGFFAHFDSSSTAYNKRKIVNCKDNDYINRFDKNYKKMRYFSIPHFFNYVAQPGFEPRLY